MLEDIINQDLKQAMLSGDKNATETLRMVKSVILYAKVSNGARDKALPDDTIVRLLQKEVQKRQESAALYSKGGSEEKANKEIAEIAVIEKYLPAKLSEHALNEIIEQVIHELGGKGEATIGSAIGMVKQRAGAGADGGDIAIKVKAHLGL